ncbi:DUF4309 domain-containing protein [Thermoflavimicrobium daqui]|uniref:DUF4309 domain-containing protein n=1 Tax=Thermoflavimicrobium daqui TaxID=2137476 RepID=UPI00143D5EF8|nr:DUF4309 domain-containing protein [Thermoflavimicrobium daqui]
MNKKELLLYSFVIMISLFLLAACNSSTNGIEKTEAVVTQKKETESKQATINQEKGQSTVNQEKEQDVNNDTNNKVEKEKEKEKKVNKEKNEKSAVLSNIMKKAKQGKVINSNLSLDDRIEEAIKRYGNPDPISLDNQYVYKKPNVILSFDRGSKEIYNIQSYDPRYKGITIKQMKAVLGKPQRDVSSHMYSYLYQASKYQVIFHFDPENKKLVDVEINNPDTSPLF